MDDHPEQPGHEAARSDAAALQNRKVPPDDRHGSFVEISEGTPRSFALEQVEYRLSGVASLLNGDLGYARQRMSVLVQGSNVSHGEHTAHSRHH